MTDSNLHDPTLAAPVFPGGEYQVDGTLGFGGMAVVYKARDLRSPRTVAIKVLRSEMARMIGTERFLREIAVTAGFTHPHILPLLDSGETKDGLGRSCLYYVMPLITGETLAERIEREEQLGVSDALRLTRDILEALQYAHEHGVIHRDIKPANVLLSGGHAVVADFGVARPLPSSHAAGIAGESLSHVGLIVGTPTYMSPEQALGEGDVDERSDMYAVACVLYEMLVGRPPFDGLPGESMISRKINAEYEPATAKRVGISSAIDAAIAIGLSPNAKDRYGSAHEFLQAISALEQRTDPTAVPSAFHIPRRYRRVAASAAFTGVALIVLFVWRVQSVVSVSNVASDKTRVAVLPLERLSSDSSLDLVASTLTSDLIDALAQFPALTVISKHGIGQFSGNMSRIDSVARSLNVGSVVSGDIRRIGDSVRVTVRLLDGASGAQVASADASGAWRNVLTVRSGLIESVTNFLRQQIGREISAAERRSATNAEAWELLARARLLADDERERWVTMAPANRAARYTLADSMLLRAIALDPKWTAPALFRGSIRMLRANAEDQAALIRPSEILANRSGERADANSLRREAARIATDVLARSADDANALYLRGWARLALWRSSTPIAFDSLRTAAEADLRAAVARRHDLADAWNDLSTLLQMSGQYAESRTAAEHALKADAYMKSAPAVIGRLSFMSLATGNANESRRWCDTGRASYPSDPRFWICELTILGWTGQTRAEVQLAWQALYDSEARDTLHIFASGKSTKLLLVAAVVARAGLADSAVSMLRTIRRDHPANVPLDQLEYGEAHVLTILGHGDQAIPLLERYLRVNPALRGQVRRSPWFAPLANNPQFLALTAPQ